MVKIKHTCDICKEEKETTNLPIPVIVPEQDGRLGVVYQSLDICQECTFKVIKVRFADGNYMLMDEQPQEQSQEQPQEQSQEQAPYQTEEIPQEPEQPDIPYDQGIEQPEPAVEDFQVSDLNLKKKGSKKNG